MTRIGATLLALAALSGCAAGMAQREARGEDPELTKALAGRIAGKPKTCLDLRDASASQQYRDAIVYRSSTRTLWRMDAPGCPLDDNAIIVSRVYSSEICRGDIFQLVDRTSGFFRGACAYGDFVPYTKAPTPPAE